MDPFYSMIDAEWSFVRIVFNRNPENYEEFNEFIETCRINLYNEKRGRFVLLVDPNGLTTLNPKYIYRIINFMQEMEPLTKKYMIELGLIVKSPAVRTIIDCLQNLKTPVVTWYIMSTEKEQEDWILSLQNRQIIFPT